MAYLRVALEQIDEANQYLRAYMKELYEIEDALASLSNSVDMDIQSQHQIHERLKLCHHSAQSIARVTKSVLDLVDSASKDYRETEAQLLTSTQRFLLLTK